MFSFRKILEKKLVGQYKPTLALEKMFILLKVNESSFRIMFSCESLFFFFIITMFLQRKQVATPAFGGAQRAIEMC